MFFRRKSPPFRSVLFVCTANITRSPAAEAFFKKLVEKSGENWKVASAGIKAVNGAPPNSVVKYVLSLRQINISKHKSQPVTKRLIADYRFILVMESVHRDAIIKLDPSFADRTFCLRTFENPTPQPSTDFPDPTGKDIADFDELFFLMEREITRVFEVLRELAVNYELKPDQD